MRKKKEKVRSEKKEERIRIIKRKVKFTELNEDCMTHNKS